MSRYRLRVELPDLPGALAKVATVISDLDGDVVSIDIHELDGHHAVDELVVEVLTELDARVLAAALEEANAGVLLSCAPAAARAEPVLDALGWAREMAEAQEATAVGRILASACRSSTVWVAPIDEAREVPVGRLALARGTPLVQRSHDLPGPSVDGRGRRCGCSRSPTVSRRRAASRSSPDPARCASPPRRSRASTRS